MNCEEVKINLHDYIDEELDDYTRREVEYHIRNCDLCFKEYKKLMLFFDRLKDLPLAVNPPNEILEQIKNELLKESGVKDQTELKLTPAQTKKIQREKERQTKKLAATNPALRKSRVTKQLVKRKLNVQSGNYLKPFLKIILPIMIIALAYFVYDISRRNYPWTVSALEGSIKIGNTTFNDGKWNEGETLTTDGNSKALIKIPKVGVIYVDNNSSLVLERGKENANRIKINNGKFRIVNSVLIPSLSLMIYNSEIIDRNGEFLLKVDSFQNIEVEVKSGFVEIYHNNKSFLVDKNYSCKIQRGMLPSIPIRVDASDSLKLAVDWFEFRNGGDQAIEKIINHSRQNDMLTLLALIPKVSQLQRQIIFQIISNNFPPPESVTRAGIIRLDEEMLYRWWEDIEWQI